MKKNDKFMRLRLIKIKFIILFLLVFFSHFFFKNGKISAQNDLALLCEELDKIEKKCEELSKTECRKLLEDCEKYFDQKSKQIEADLSKTKAKKRTLQNKIYSLTKEIKSLNLKIQQGNLIIKDLTLQLSDTENSIMKTSQEIGKKKEKLAEILRKIYEEDQKTPLEIFLSENKISNFFDNLISLELLTEKNKEVLKDIKYLKKILEDQKKNLDEEKEELEKQLVIQLLQKQKTEKVKKEKEYLLSKTKGKEAQYQAFLKETREKAEEIRARIFELIGVSKAPTFGEAVKLARYVEKITGVRAAFLLAILTQESNIGKNVGQCYLKDPKTGRGVVVKTGEKKERVMNPKRDVSYFIQITKKLGRDPYHTLVSCPMSYGWGGAMGPAQFIPSTWMLYKDKVKTILGKEPDPWEIKDAFLMAGIYLKELGAEKNEWKAAMRYFSGFSWKKYEEFYGNSVMRLARKYQKDIEAIGG